MNSTTEPYRYLLNLSYLGTPFCGWQSQSNVETVQKTVQEQLEKIFRHPIKLKGASRTDSGVHAANQFAMFDSERLVELKSLYASLCGLLPRSVQVKEIKFVPSEFDVIANCRGKIYVYRIWNGRSTNPLIDPLVWHLYSYEIDFERLQEILSLWVGRHNFKAFAASDASSLTFEREIFEIQLMQQGPYFEIWFSGNGFLKQMIRNIVGTAMDVMRGRLTKQDIVDAFNHGKRKLMGYCAPSSGLCLQQIYYDNVPKISELTNSERPLGALIL